MSKPKRKPRKRSPPKGDASREGRQNGTTAAEIDKAELKQQILSLRKAGLSWRQIARSVGRKGHGYVHTLYTAAIAEVYQEPALQQKRLELERLDDLWRAVYPLATGQPVVNEDGSLGPRRPVSIEAQRQCLRIMARRARYLGHDAPKVERHLNSFVGDDAFERWTEEEMRIYAETGKLPKHERESED